MIHPTTIGLTSASNAASPDTAMEVAMPDSSNNVNTRDGASIVWGPEIRVDGKRPEWLRSHDAMQWRGKNDHKFYGKGLPAERYIDGETLDDCMDFIRLRADHPHYRQPTTPESDPALWDRMEALVRRMALCDAAEFGVMGTGCREAYVEASEIALALPKPVDPDLLLAREIVAEEYGDGNNVAHLAEQARSGEGDEWFHTKVVLRAIRKLRSTPEVSHVG